MTGTTLLRRYFVKPGHWEAFLPMWHRVVAIRRRFGFTVQCAYEDRERNVFTWAISHPGDIEAVHALYYQDPERMEVAGITDHLERWEITPVRPVDLAPG